MTAERAQRASRVLMIRPDGFGRDDQAAETNAFMRKPVETADRIREQARKEFDTLALTLQEAGVGVLVFDDELGLPDSTFPNNWISYHQPIVSGKPANPIVVTYPMLTEARRRERRSEILDAVAGFTGVRPDHIDLSALEKENEILEGTGSLVLDRIHGVAYACVSARTTDYALDTWGDELGYEVVRFHAADGDGNPVYHTNVVMSIGEKFAVVCLESITDPDEYDLVEAALRRSGREIMTITLDQVAHFCGNILELQNARGESVFAMSKSAFEHFTPAQQERFASQGRVVRVAIPTIEYVAGGSVRCMLAELGC